MSLVRLVKRELGEYFFGLETIRMIKQHNSFTREFNPKPLLEMALSEHKRSLRGEYFYHGFTNVVRAVGIAELIISHIPYVLILNEAFRLFTYYRFHPRTHLAPMLERNKAAMKDLTSLEEDYNLPPEDN